MTTLQCCALVTTPKCCVFRSAAVGVLMALLSQIAMAGHAFAYTGKEAHIIFDILDPEHHGKVTKVEFEAYKVDAFYFRRMPGDIGAMKGAMKPLRFEDTGLSREFFERNDTNHDGAIDALEMLDAVKFETIDRKHRGYFDFTDFTEFLATIAR